MRRQQMTLTLLWWGWGSVLLLMLVLLSYQSAIFGDEVTAAWEWFVPNLIPTLMLVGAAAYQKGKAAPGDPADARLFMIALVASIIYLLLLTIAQLSVLFTVEPIKTLRMSSLWLGPLQGLCASALGVFFVGGGASDA